MDRRVKYTKRVLNESLIRFLEQKEITRITVTEICTDADVNRSTYYAHFEDPYDQLNKVKAELLGDMAEYIVQIDTRQLPAEESQYMILRTILEYIESKKNVFRILTGRSGDHNLQEEILAILGEKAFHKAVEGIEDTEQREYLLRYASNGCFGLFYRWLMKEDDVPAAKVARMMADFTGSLLEGLCR